MSVKLTPFFQDNDWNALRLFLSQLMSRSVDGGNPNFRALKNRLANTSNATAISSTTTETDFSVDYTLSQNLYRVGSIFKFDIAGSYSAVTPATSTGYIFRIKLNAANALVFANKAGISGASSEEWRISGGTVVRTIGSSGVLLMWATLFFKTSSGVDTIQTEVASISVNTTSTTEVDLRVSVQMDDTDGQADLHAFVFESSDF